MNAVAAAGLVGLSLGGLTPGDGPGARPARFEFTETHMGSPFKIVLYSPDGAAARRASRAAFDRIAALDAAFSDYQPLSGLDG